MGGQSSSSVLKKITAWTWTNPLTLNAMTNELQLYVFFEVKKVFNQPSFEDIVTHQLFVVN